MPKYVIHTIVMEKTAEKLASSSNQELREMGRIMIENRGYAVLGAIGPDLFFWAPDYVVCQVLLEFYRAWDMVKEVYNRTIGKVVEAVEVVKEATEDLMEIVSPGVAGNLRIIFREMEELFNQFMMLLMRGPLAASLRMENLATDIVKLPDATALIFDQFKPPLQLGKSEKEWYWFDMLHYRETGIFGKTLIELAESEEEKAYAYGYITHIATDFVGHGYVNQIVGAPYRNAVQRHVVVENFMDTWAFHQYTGGDIATDLVKWLDLPERLTPGIIEMIYKAFKRVYKNLPHPELLKTEFLTMRDIETTYNLFLRVTRMLEDRIREPEEPFSEMMEVLEEMGERFWEYLSNPPEPPERGDGCSLEDILSFGITDSSRDCYRKFLDEMDDWLKWIGEVIVWHLESFKRLVNLLETALTTLAAIYILGFLYFMQMSLYAILMKIRQLFALNALVYPPVSLVYTSHGRNLITPFQCGSKVYPYPAAWEMSRCLNCPGSNGYESPYTIPSTYSPTDTPKTFIEELSLDLRALKAYANAKTPEDTRRIYVTSSVFSPVTAVTTKEGLPSVPKVGSAVELAYWMLANWRDPIASVNWNLDSDRGFGYKQWRGKLPPENSTVENETYDIYS